MLTTNEPMLTIAWSDSVQIALAIRCPIGAKCPAMMAAAGSLSDTAATEGRTGRFGVSGVQAPAPRALGP